MSNFSCSRNWSCEIVFDDLLKTYDGSRIYPNDMYMLLLVYASKTISQLQFLLQLLTNINRVAFEKNRNFYFGEFDNET